MNKKEMNKLISEALNLGLGKIGKDIEKDYTILTLAAALNSHLYAHKSMINMCSQLIDVLLDSNTCLSKKINELSDDFNTQEFLDNLSELQKSIRQSIVESEKLIKHTEESPLVEEQLTDVRSEINLDRFKDLYKK